ncbi:nucleotide-sugar transporter [Guyanagaster necrorhizus]|uniref:Nucleotide-sugar transporter n=1 Tax=Guyanagaster necrorhizus TaxID=856835 RepID=A0A9P7VUU2_9AGAR|nr:nucleotide-sugar transporter [Guyanagaster necrorhizus MCA 3950]KAG7447901.1 nucleotide-sugar transporter [Guyanagaster necrorhizus MCA 3950]
MSQHPNALKINIDTDSKHDHDTENQVVASDAAAPSVPSLWGVPLKYISLVTLAVQNSALTIIMHYSRVSTPPSQVYSAATAVLMNEILKGVISLIFAFSRIDASSPLSIPVPFNPEPPKPRFLRSCTPSLLLVRVKKLCAELFSPDCWKLSIPAILYVIQNNLQYVAASNLEAATFQVSYQMKILTTAAFSVMMLRKRLLSTQWIALLFLAIGVGIVQIQTGACKDDASAVDAHSMNATKGFLAVVAACFTSGLAGVYFEMVLKNSQGDLWVRNVQLSLFSLLPCIAPIIVSSSGSGSNFGSVSALFHNFGPWAWATVGVQVLGGLVTAMVIKYSDNILKGFATSLSIVLSFLASVALFDFHITFTFMLGSAIVLNATWLYNQQPRRVGLGVSRDTKTWSALGWNEKRLIVYRSPSVPTLGSGMFSSTTSRCSSVASLSSLSVNNVPLAESDL